MDATSRGVDWAHLLSRVPETEADYASLRVLGRTTIGKSFALRFGPAEDIGAPARTIWQVIAEDDGRSRKIEGEEESVVELHQSPAGRVQVKARVVKSRGRVAEIRFERSTGRVGKDASLETLLNLDEEASRRLIDLCCAIKGVDPMAEETLKIDEAVMSTVMQNPQALAAIYDRDPERFAAVIQADVSARDVVAIASRKKAIERFEALLSDPAEFSAARQGATREAVWQRFFESNPWILGVGLAGQLLTAWDPGKLEQVVAGHSISDVGKRVDAVLSTTGLIRSLVFAEIKLHDDPLLESSEYRPGTWAPSRAVAGGVAQALVTAARARDDLGAWISARDDAGYRTGEEIFSGSPRSFLVVGTLASLMREGHAHSDKVRSFELYRAATTFPEIVTYDEVLARAKWSLDLAESSSSDG
ncbi:Shedu immune nuclease family protein [Microbacterium memoriense]|uniref:DUF4263 domain-containing protein n=1 Tax=Microbacterium memoriense TaxID=2978350 RepID=A0ABT2PAS5_9MICO|nr:Shedu immune nuclease family protein [Microbacterium memoriense]MCT9001676.1 DUF4263 domain-containing protein [Microbacterium memoriense]